MEELIAKKYIKAITSSTDATGLENINTIFSVLSESFKDEKFKNVINNPGISSEDKAGILLDAVKSANSEHVNNLIKLLVEKNRLNVIPAFAEALRKSIAHSTKTYEGLVYSDTDMDTKVIQDLSDGLSKKFDSKISLSFAKADFDGIKVDVEDLGIEIDFSKSRINEQIVEHIIKAI
jgi:F-type H+-transporting ATPase subunit delta